MNDRAHISRSWNTAATTTDDDVTYVEAPPPRIIAVSVDGDGLRFTFEDWQSYRINGQQLAALVGPVLLAALGQATGVDHEDGGREDDEVPF